MHIQRSKLLITLALFCVLAIGPPHASAATASLGYVSADGSTSTSYSPGGATPNSGEPDAGGGTRPQTTTHTSLSMSSSDSGTASATVSSGRYMAIALRWAWVFWMARYFGLTQ